MAESPSNPQIRCDSEALPKPAAASCVKSTSGPIKAASAVWALGARCHVHVGRFASSALVVLVA